MELPSRIYTRITELSERGNELLDDGKPQDAIRYWRTALDLVPEPKTEWEAATWLYASIGDAYFSTAQYADAAHALYDALNCPEGQSNAFVHYRLGQCLLKLNDEENAAQSLVSAYMLDGKEIFDTDGSDGKEALNFLAKRNLL